MKNKIKKILFSGILSLVLVFAFAFASLNVLRTDDRAHAADPVSYHFEGALYLSDHDGRFEISFDLLVDEDITIADARPIVSAAIEAEYPTIAVEELYFNDREMYSQDEIDLGWMGVKKLNEAKLSLLATHDTTYDKIILIDGFYGPKTNNQQSQKKIEFTTVPQYVENETSLPNYRYASGEGANDSFLVTSNLPTFYIDYNVTYNDGVNSLLLLPTFDTDFFEIKDVTVYNETAGWEEATITKDGFDRILLEGSALFSNSKAVDSTEAPVTLLRIKFATKKVEGITGTHAFGLDLAKNGNDQNTYSQAFKWLDGTKLGEQEEVTVVVNNAADANQVRFFEMQTPRMEIKTNSESLEEELTVFYEDEAIHYLEFTYAGSPVTTKLNKFTNLTDFEDALEEMETPNLRVDYLYYGASTLEESNVTVNWYNAEFTDDDIVKGDPINNDAAPTRPGWYVVEITAPQADIFSSITKTGIIHIKRATLSITLENKTSEYGTTLATLTYMYGDNHYNSGTAFEAPNHENITVTLSTVAGTEGHTNVGSYDITASVSSPNYIINITNNDQKAIYTITARKITVRVEQGTQEVVYSGSEPTIAKDYTVHYAVVGNTITDGDVASALKEGQVVTLELVPYENVSKWNVGFYYIQGKLNNTNYEIVDQTKGTLKITSQNVSFDNCFEGDTVVYDGQEHNLLKVVGNIPSYVEYEPQSYIRTNAGNYNITVILTLSEQDAANYTNGQTLIEIPVVGTISKRDIYVKAIDKSSDYHAQAAVLEWERDDDAALEAGQNNNNPQNTLVGTDSLGFTLFVREGQTKIENISEANAGTYTIDFDLSNANSNYNIHKTTAIYTINRIDPTIEITAANVNYNRHLDISAKVNGSDYAYVVKKGEVVQNLSTVLDAGTYTVVVTYAQTTNYNEKVETKDFTISKVNLSLPTVTYSGKTATWTAVTTDAVENDNKELYNATLTYTVTNGLGTISDKTYTAVVADKGQQLTLHVASSNANYNAVDVNLNAVYEVTFAEGSHEYNSANATPMPASQLLFAGQKATAPTSNPALDGYTFAGWYLNDAEYGFANVQDGVTANIELVAHWGTETYTVTISKRNENGVVEVTEYEAHYNQELGTTGPTNASFGQYVMMGNLYLEGYNFTFPSKAAAEADEEYSADDYGIIFGFDTWMIDNTPKTPEEVVATKVTGDINVTIRYKVVDYVEFTVTYYIRTYVSNGNEWNTDYTGPYTTKKVKYGTAITYETLVATPWFASDVWYLDEARNIPAPATMPNENINVYGAYVFDIGNGDVDADKIVSTDDIQVYRELIVGGYNIKDISVDGTLPASKEFANTNKYFLRLVADVNGDNSFDIRDVSTIRMTLVQNYGWDKETGYNVSGNEVVRNVSTDAFADISTALQAGNKVTLSGDVTAAESALALSVAGNVTLDLNGKTLTVAKVDLTVTNRGTLTVKNGTIVTTQGITLRAPYGNVTIDGVNGFDANGAVNLQAAEHSLHLAGKVGFYKGVNTTATPDQLVPAAVKVAQNTHVVLESAAELVVEKLVVAKVVETTENDTVEFTVPTQEALTEEYIISIENNTVNSNVVTVEGYVDVETNEIKTFEQLVAAGQKGGIYTLEADLDLTAQVVVSKALVLDLNGHKLSNTTDIWNEAIDAWSLISVQKGGDLTIKGNGTLDAKQNDCYAVDVRDGANLVIENGTIVGNISAVYAYEGTVTINGGHFSIKQLSNNATDKHRFTLNLYDANRVAGTATIVVKGGEFEHFNPSNNLAEGPKTNFVAAGYVVSASNDVYTVTTGNAIASVDDLIDAIANCGNYVLMADVVFGGQASFANDTTINLNGYKLQSTNNTALSAVDGATLTLNGDGEVEAQEFCAIALKGSHLVINGGTYTSHDNAVFGTNGTVNAQQGDYGHNTITINGGVFNGGIQTAGYVACGIYVANSDTVVVNAGTFNIANGVGILARSGNTTVKEGVVFNVTGDGHFGKVGDSKVTVPAGAVLVLDLAANYPGGDPTLVNNTTNKVAVVAGSEADMTYANQRADVNKIVLGADIACNSDIVYSKDMTLDLNGHTITFASWGFEVNNGKTLTINGNGNVNAVEAALYAREAAKLVVNGGTYTSTANFVIGTNGSNGVGNNEITINGGTFNASMPAAGVAEGYIACAIYVANSDTVVVNAGTFNVTDGVGIVARSGNTTVANGVVLNVTGSGTCGKVGDSRVVIPSGAALVLDLEAGYPGGTPVLLNGTAYEVVTIANGIVNINNLAQLKAFRDDVNAGNNYAGKTVVLNANITLDGAWEAISNYSRKDSANESKWFAGTFDGRGHVISGLTNNSANIVEKEEFTYGLFGSVKNAVIKNLTLASVNISTNKGDSLGALVGYYAGSTQKSEANISNITVSGTVAGADNVGGVVGRAAGDYFKAENITVNGTVTALKKAAGVVGTGNAHEMVFANCANHAAVSSTEADSNQGYNTVAGISITWKGQDDQHPVCTKVVLTNCSNDGVLSTCNTSSLAGQLAVDYSPKTQLNSNGTWTYANGQWTCQ